MHILLAILQRYYFHITRADGLSCASRFTSGLLPTPRHTHTHTDTDTHTRVLAMSRSICNATQFSPHNEIPGSCEKMMWSSGQAYGSPEGEYEIHILRLHLLGSVQLDPPGSIDPNRRDAKLAGCWKHFPKWRYPTPEPSPSDRFWFRISSHHAVSGQEAEAEAEEEEGEVSTFHSLKSSEA